MRLSVGFICLALLQLSSPACAKVPLASRQLRARDYENKDYYALELSETINPEVVAQHFGLEVEGPLGALPNHYLFSVATGPRDIVTDEIQRYRRLKKRDSRLDELYGSLLFAQKQKLKKLHKRAVPPTSPRPGWNAQAAQNERDGQDQLKALMSALEIADPMFNRQWHLFNTKQPGNDVNVTGVWLQGIIGQNVTVSIVDDGLDMYSDDLKENYFKEGSYDFNDNSPEPKPRLSDDRHGTRCAGEVAAVKNNVCGIGVAYGAKVSGIRMLSKQISDADEAIALNYAYHENHIYSCSWGPPDDGRAMDAPGILIQKSMVLGVQKGRHGLGSVFVFASGNGAASDDNCNFDGYTNSIYSITVGAVDRLGTHPYYSESCSANMVVTYSSGGGDAIHTTDVGTNECSHDHGGTSAAAPLAAGIFALVLSVRPDLTWRDLQYLCLETAVMVVPNDPDWKETARGKKFNHKFGYGSLDAFAIVEAAKTWKLVKPQAWLHSPVLKVDAPIPESGKGLRSHITITEKDLIEANLDRVEHVTVTMNLRHGRRGDVSVDLVSPANVVSHIATARYNDASTRGYVDWTFMSVKHWGENGIGDWAIIVKDENENEFQGSLIDWRITLWGECIDPTKAVLHPLPGDLMNNTHPLPQPFTSTASAHTTSVSLPASSKPPATVPTDHPDRPVNSKPSASASSSADASSPTTTQTVKPTESPEPSGGSNDRPLFLPSFLPTFGVSGTTQAWIYGSFVVIILFVIGVGLYLCMQKKKRKASSSDYEFTVLQDEEEGTGGSGVASSSRAAGAAAGRRKARELYDAFGASDEDEDIFSDEDEKEYRSARDYDLEAEEQTHGIDEGRRELGGDREALLGRNRD